STVFRGSLAAHEAFLFQTVQDTSNCRAVGADLPRQLGSQHPVPSAEPAEHVELRRRQVQCRYPRLDFAPQALAHAPQPEDESDLVHPRVPQNAGHKNSVCEVYRLPARRSRSFDEASQGRGAARQEICRLTANDDREGGARGRPGSGATALLQERQARQVDDVPGKVWKGNPAAGRGGGAAMSQKEIEMILARQLASCLALPIFLVDPSGALVFYNEPAEAILGRRFEETGEMPASEWSTFFSPTD